MKTLIGGLVMLCVFDFLTIAYACPPAGSTCSTACKLQSEWCAAGGPGAEFYDFLGASVVPGARCVNGGNANVTPGKPKPMFFDVYSDAAPTCGSTGNWVTDGWTDGSFLGTYQTRRNMTIFTDCGAYK